jgi:hypothetical protein
MRLHATDEGHQLQQGLRHAGYTLHGADLGPSLTDVRAILGRDDPSVVVVQDPREWLGLTADRTRDPRMRFTNLDALRDRPDVFRVGVVKDAQSDGPLHAQTALEAGTHAWVTYYHADAVCRVAPHLRREHLVRTYHSVDAEMVPPYADRGRSGCVVSGALGGAYPLRTRLARDAARLPDCTVLRHPGYHRRGSATPDYLRALARFKVAVCTASVYGYALRKLVEGTACGCVVITDLPESDCLPHIDKNLIRVSPDMPTKVISDIIREAESTYCPEKQAAFALAACRYYDFRAAGERLACDIERARLGYSDARREPEGMCGAGL